MLALKNLTPIKAGGERLVFQHPERDDLVIKVIRPEVVEERYRTKLLSFKARRRVGRYINFHRQIREYLSIWANHGKRAPILARLEGLTETDLGVGLVEEKLVDRNGQIAPSLLKLIQKRGFSPELREAVDELRARADEFGVILSDVNPNNLLYAYDRSLGTRLVVVDGIGDKRFIPILSFSKAANRRNNRRLFGKMLFRLERRIGQPLVDDGAAPQALAREPRT